MTAAQIEDAAKHRAAITAHLNALLGGDAAVLVPATPFAAPKLGMPVEQLDDCWMPIITLVAPAAMAGLPQARSGGVPTVAVLGRRRREISHGSGVGKGPLPVACEKVVHEPRQ